MITAWASRWFVTVTQTAFWGIFMVLDAYLLIPVILMRYLGRVKSTRTTSHVLDRRRRHPQTVVIVGGNFAGLAALRELQNNPLFQVVLIDQHDYFEYTPGILRLFCEPHRIANLCHPLPHGTHRILQGKVTKTNHTANTVTYVDANTHKSITIKYDYLILATGSTYHYPVSAHKDERTIAQRAAGWKVEAKKVRDATSILILGGGAVGTELAAEIAGHYPCGTTGDHVAGGTHRKTITLVDASPRLVPMFPPKVSAYAKEWLTSNGVDLMLGQMLESWDTKSCTLKNGTRITADLVFVCFGDKPNSSPLVDNNPSSKNGTTTKALQPFVKLDRRKYVKTDAFLRVEGRRNVFGCGDVAAPPSEGVKQAFHAEVMGHVAAENVNRLASGQRYMRYPEDAASGSHQMPLVYVLSLGKWDGVIGFNGLVVPGPFAAVLKWIIEWTKVRQMLGRPVGTIVWIIGDVVAFFLSRTFIKPIPQQSNR